MYIRTYPVNWGQSFNREFRVVTVICFVFLSLFVRQNCPRIMELPRWTLTAGLGSDILSLRHKLLTVVLKTLDGIKLSTGKNTKHDTGFIFLSGPLQSDLIMLAL